MGKGIVNFIKPAEKPKKPKPAKKRNKPKEVPKKSQNIKVEEPQILINPEDFALSSLIDGNGIHVITKYLEQSVNVCTLPRALFKSWLKSSPQQRANYVSSQTNINDTRIKQMIIRETVNVINKIFARAR
jgi:hypothetical protein